MAVYDTTKDIEAQGLKEHALSVSRAQDAAVTDFFKADPFGKYPKHVVHARCMPEAPITSAGRSLSDLSRTGVLTKMLPKDNIKGPWGRNVNVWMLRNDWHVCNDKGWLIRYKTQYEKRMGIVTLGPIPTPEVA